MRPPRLPGLLLAALLAAPLAGAGTPEDPEITDPRDQAWTPTDLLAAWFEAEKEGLRFSIRTMDGGMPERYPGHVYWVGFRVEGRPVEAAVGFGHDGVMRGHLGTFPWDERRPQPFELAANGGVVELRSERGRPSTWSGLVPWGAAPGLEPGATLLDLRAGTSYFDLSAARWREGLDVAGTPQAFVANPPRPLLPILVPAWVLPTVVVGATVAGAGGGLAAALLFPPKPRVETPTPAPVPRPPPPGKRFRRDPRAPLP